MSDTEDRDSTVRRSSLTHLVPEQVESSYNRATTSSAVYNRRNSNTSENMLSSFSFKYTEYVRPLIAEFVGQLMFAFLHSSTANTISAVGSTVPGNALLPAISDGLTVTILVVIIGGISGAHVNFAVTTAVALGRGMKLIMVPFYLIAQMLGSLAGAGLATATNGGAFGEFALGANVTVGQGLLMEVMLSAFLTMAVLMAAVELNAVQAAFAIGFTILIDILAGFNVSGGCMNPTLSFGPAVVAGQWENYWIYWVGPILGAVLSALIFRIFLGDKSRLLCNDPQSSSSYSTSSGSPDEAKTRKSTSKDSFDAEPQV